MSVKNLYYYVQKLSDEDKNQSHISLSTNLNIFVNNKSYNINKVFIEGTRDNFTLYVLIENVKYYFYGAYYPLTNKHVFYWYKDEKSYYTIDSPLTNKSVSPVILVKNDKDPFKYLTLDNNNFAHSININESVINFLLNNIFYFNDVITKEILKNYFIFNILLFWITIIIVILIVIFIIYKIITKPKNIKNIENIINYEEDDEEEDDE
jgi:hypothetical protein